MKIGIQNIEELIFKNSYIWKKMPDLIDLRNQWSLSQISPSLRQTGKKALLDFLQKADEKVLSEYFGEKITIDRLDYNSIKNIEFNTNEDVDLNQYIQYNYLSQYIQYN